MANHIQRSLLLAQSNVQWSWAGGIKICPCQILALTVCWIIGLLSYSCCYKLLRKQKLFKRKCQKKSLPLLTVALTSMSLPFTAPPAISGTINEPEGSPWPIASMAGSTQGAEEDSCSHSSKDVYRGMCFPLRSYQVPLTLLPSNVDVLQPASVIHSTWLFSYHLPSTGLRFLQKCCLSVSVPAGACGGCWFSGELQTLIQCTPIPVVSNHSTPVWTAMCSHWALLYCAVIKKSWVLFKYRAFCPKPSSACGCE